MTLHLASIDELDLRDYLRPGDGVVWGQGCAEPATLTAVLRRQASAVGGVRCFVGVVLADSIEPADSIVLSSYCATARNRGWLAEGRLDLLPIHYSHLSSAFGRSVDADVVFLQLPRPDAAGRYRFGLAEDYLGAAMAAARVVIAEVSPSVPFIPNGTVLDGRRLDVVVHSNAEPTEFRSELPTTVDRAIASHVASLVVDGSTVQVGLGSLPNAVLAGLRDHNELSFHSGLIVDEVAPLMRSGVVRSTVGALVMGQRSLFDFVDHNPSIALRPSSYTHDADVLAAIPRFTAINSALEVDLTGQINTESIDGRYVGAVGGALDFVRGAHRSVGGVPITVLASTAGGRSCIVRELSGPASIPRADAGIVVTEYGCADLRGRSLRDRQRMLTEIAHPNHREDTLGRRTVGLVG